MASRSPSEDSSSTTCKRCNRSYDDPRMLPCLHSFCKVCIDGLIMMNTHGSSKPTVCCPTCHTSTPFCGVEELPKNAHLNYKSMLGKYASQIQGEILPACDECSRDPPQGTVSFCCTCQSFLCKECHSQHVLSRKIALNHKVLMIEGAKKMKNLQDELERFIPPPSALKCQLHEGSEIKFACTTCNVLVCIECTVIKHQGHKFEELTKHATRQKKKVTEGKELLAQAEIKLQEGIKEAKAVMDKVEGKRKEIDAKIEEEFQRLEVAVSNRKKELLAKSKEISTATLTGLSIQIDEMSSLKDQIASCNSTVADISANFSDAEILAVITQLLAQLGRLSERFEKQTLEPTESDTMTVEIDSSWIQSAITAFGVVSMTPT